MKRGPISQEQIDNLKSLNLRNIDVQSSLCGFICAALLRRYEIEFDPQEIHAIVRMYVVATDEVIEDAAQVYEALRKAGQI